MRNLSKSKLLAFRQCPKRLWLEIHKKELRADSAATEASFAIGHQVGDIARRLYDPDGKGHLIDIESEGFERAFSRSKELLETVQPIFEAGFTAGGGMAFADVMLPVRKGGKKYWRMVEVKSSTSVKDYHRDDTAVQAYIARTAGVPLLSVALAHIDSSWVYPGGNDYQGLLVEEDLTEQAFGREAEVKIWIAEAQSIAAKRKEPDVGTGKHCWSPYECGFLEYCDSQEEQAEFPIDWLPRIQKKALKEHIDTQGVTDMRQVPDELLNERQLRVKTHTLAGTTFFDATNAAANLAACTLPACFIDFETIQFPVPIWKGTRPYQQIPFQFSVHVLSPTGRLSHTPFLDISGSDPSKGFAEALLAACGSEGPVFVYNASFEMARIRELGERFPKLNKSLMAINDRIVDLLPIAEQHYYHPSQQGSWSIKKVLPAVAPELRYDALDGVQDGGMAMDAFLEAIHPDTDKARASEIEKQLLEYCTLDTYAMVRLWQFFTGRNDLKL
jgi:CRISPR/Cas system-associated exonuclease Cas4 (RecB family)